MSVGRWIVAGALIVLCPPLGLIVAGLLLTRPERPRKVLSEAPVRPLRPSTREDWQRPPSPRPAWTQMGAYLQNGGQR